MSHQKNGIRRLAVLILLVPLITLTFSSCGSRGIDSNQIDQSVQSTQGFGLSKDSSVALGWPADPLQTRIQYYNTLQTDSPWLVSNDNDIHAPKSVAVNSAADKLYVSTGYGVYVVDTTSGKITPFADTGLDAVNAPHGIAVAPDDNVYIIDKDSNKVKVFTPTGEFVREFGDFENPVGIAIDSKLLRSYVVDSLANTVTAWDMDGKFLFSFTQSTDMPLEVPVHIAVNSKGLVYVLNWGVNKIHIFSSDGAFIRSFGEQGVWSSQFIRPKGIAIDTDDNVYVTDSSFDNFQIFDSNDQLCLWVGSTGVGPGEFNMPSQLTIDSKNRIYVAEYGSHRVQIFQYLTK